MEGLKIFFDGGCRPNPGTMELAVVTRGRLYYKADVGRGDNNDAEWLALLYAMEIAVSLGAADVEFVGDALPVINQAKGLGKCRSYELREHRAAFDVLAREFARIRIRHVRRSQNLAGIALERRRSGY